MYIYIYGAAANASKWQMGFNSAFKGLMKDITSCIFSVGRRMRSVQ
jgi:hypothetical protein